MTTTESPQGQPVPTEPIDDLIQEARSVISLPRGSVKNNAIKDIIFTLAALDSRRLSAQPSGATVSRGDRDVIAATLYDHLFDYGRGITMERAAKVADLIIAALTTPTETTDSAMEDV